MIADLYFTVDINALSYIVCFQMSLFHCFIPEYFFVNFCSAKLGCHLICEGERGGECRDPKVRWRVLLLISLRYLHLLQRSWVLISFIYNIQSSNWVHTNNNSSSPFKECYIIVYKGNWELIGVKAYLLYYTTTLLFIMYALINLGPVHILLCYAKRLQLKSDSE